LNSYEKRCTRCASTRKKEDFCHIRGKNLQYEHSTCNQCHTKIKNTRKEIDPFSRKKTKLKANLDEQIPTISTTVSQTNANRTFSDITNIDLDDFLEEQSPDALQEINNNNDANSSDLMYTLDEVQELVTKQFQDAEYLNEPVKLIFEIELDSQLIESVFSNQQKFWLNMHTHDMETIKKNFHQLTDILLLPLEFGSGYYWEIRNILISQ
jgi:hypothetical protein